MVEIVAFASPLTHPSENGETAVLHGDVIDQLLNDDSLADARAAERADFSTLGEGANEIDDLDAGFENLGTRVLVDQFRSFPMNRITLGELHRAAYYRPDRP